MREKERGIIIKKSFKTQKQFKAKNTDNRLKVKEEYKKGTAWCDWSRDKKKEREKERKRNCIWNILIFMVNDSFYKSSSLQQ